MTSKTENYLKTAGLVEVRDPEIENPICRSPAYQGITEFGKMDEKIGEALRLAREARDLTRPDFVPLLGLTPQVYGRYERGEAKMHVTRLVHLSELLRFSPLDLLYAAAPHLWGGSEEEANTRHRLMKYIEELPLEKVKLMSEIAKAFAALQPADQTNEAGDETT